MKDYYDFSKGKKNPYTKLLMQEVTLNLSNRAIEYFKKLSEESGCSYKTLINFCLLDCVEKKRLPKNDWEPEKPNESK